ncbi:hypothetical protein HJIV1_gp3 [Haloterrigena jeotgali icosahedral virus 1]|nr:hypothetical protein HJIV1_gp3 [Haloterrigena jeotgali icosahedral virus 1]
MSNRLDRVEKAVRRHPDPVVSTTEVVDALEDDVTRRTVLDDLRLLERADALESKDIGSRAVAWWHVDRVVAPPPPDPADHPDQRGLGEQGLEDDVDQEASVDDDRRDDHVAAGHAVDDDQEARVDAGRHDGLEDALADWRPGKPRDREERREIGFEALEWLQQQSGPRTRAEFVSALYEQTHLDGQGEDSWWQRVVRPALNRAVDQGVIEKPSHIKYQWPTDE